jgi:mono/diheme cytochrome c family protein
MKILGWVAVALVAMQAIPYGHSHTNPRSNGEPAWDSPETKQLFQRACFDCHTNQTVWPWYSHVAPVNWLLARDVNAGRRHLNFSDWNQPHKHSKDVSNQVRFGEMPPWFYLPMHPGARLTDDEKQRLMDGAAKSLGVQNSADSPH